MKFESYLNEEVKLTPMKVKKAFDLILNPKKFFSDQKTFKKGSIDYVLQLSSDHSTNQTTVKPYIKKVVKKLEEFGFVKTEERPPGLKWRNADEIWIKNDISVLIYLSPKDEVVSAYFYVTIFDLNQHKKANDAAAEKTRRWVTKNSSFQD